MWSADQGLSRWGTQAAVWLVTARSPNGAGDSAIPLPGRHPPAPCSHTSSVPPAALRPHSSPPHKPLQGSQCTGRPQLLPCTTAPVPTIPVQLLTQIVLHTPRGAQLPPTVHIHSSSPCAPFPISSPGPLCSPRCTEPLRSLCVCSHLSVHPCRALSIPQSPPVRSHPSDSHPTTPLGLPSPPSLWVLSKNNISEGLGKKKNTIIYNKNN